MEDDLVSSFSLAVGLSMRNNGEAGLAYEGANIICDLGGVKLASVVKNHCKRDVETGDDVLPDELSKPDRYDGGYGLSFHPLG